MISSSGAIWIPWLSAQGENHISESGRCPRVLSMNCPGGYDLSSNCPGRQILLEKDIFTILINPPFTYLPS